jgi:hypothetical protein
MKKKLFLILNGLCVLIFAFALYFGFGTSTAKATCMNGEVVWSISGFSVNNVTTYGATTTPFSLTGGWNDCAGNFTIPVGFTITVNGTLRASGTNNPDQAYTRYNHTFTGNMDVSGLAGGTYTAQAKVGDATSNVTFTIPTPPPMSGTLTPPSTSCTIGAGSNSCNVNLSWSTNNPQGTSAVTASGMSNVNGNSGSQAFPVPYSSRTFYLYNNAILLAQSSATASCTSGTSWNGSSCVTVVNGSCSSTHYNCSSGASANNVSGSSAWTWDCNGSNGGGNASCSETKPSMTGTLTPATSSCTIPSGSSTCTINYTWTTANPAATSQVTTAYPTNNTVVGNGNNSSANFTIPYSTSSNPLTNPIKFYLYNNGVQLTTATATAGCTSGTGWDGSKCTTGTWSAWSPTSCPTACGLPASNQTRTCTGPTGATCSGSSTQSCAATSSCATVNGACSNPVKHYACAVGQSINNVSSTSAWTWYCDNSANGGGVSGKCTQSKSAPKPIEN